MNTHRIAQALRMLADALEEDEGEAAPVARKPPPQELKVDEVAKARARRSLRKLGVALEDE